MDEKPSIHHLVNRSHIRITTLHVRMRIDFETLRARVEFPFEYVYEEDETPINFESQRSINATNE